MTWLKERNKDVCPLGSAPIKKIAGRACPCESEIDSRYDCEYKALTIISKRGATVRCRYGSPKLPRKDPAISEHLNPGPDRPRRVK